MLRKVAPLASLLLLVAATSAEEDISNEANILPTDAGDRQAKRGFATTALIADMARNLIHQSYSNSQVLSLNLSNVFILVLLKAILFTIGHYGFGQGLFGKGFDHKGPYGEPGGYGGGFGGGGGLWGRVDPDSQPRGLPNQDTGLSVTEGELLLGLGYLTGERRGDYGCLYRAACMDYNGRAPQYLAAGRVLLKAANVVSSVITVNPKYSHIVDGFEEAVRTGSKGNDCSVKYQCESDS